MMIIYEIRKKYIYSSAIHMCVGKFVPYDGEKNESKIVRTKEMIEYAENKMIFKINISIYAILKHVRSRD